MSRLTIYNDANAEKIAEYTSYEDIARILADAGLRFERWQASQPLAAQATPEEVLAAYDAPIKKLMQERGYITVDVVSLHPEAANLEAIRMKFLDEHTHAEDEVRFFVDGSGMFYIHQDGKVLMLLCEKEDLISVPAGTRHWFDMGPKPFFKAIRLFNNPEGWVAKFTGDKIADRFPKYEN